MFVWVYLPVHASFRGPRPLGSVLSSTTISKTLIWRLVLYRARLLSVSSRRRIFSKKFRINTADC
jgi:hypothetical protein